MKSVVRRLGTLSLAVALVSLSGCNDAQSAADSQAESGINEASQDMTQGQFDAAQTAAAAAASTADVSPEVQSRAQSLQGAAKLAQAQKLLVQAQDVQANVDRILGEIRLSTARVAEAKARIGGFDKLDPAPTIDLLKQRIAEAQGGAGQTDWPLPSLGDNASGQASPADAVSLHTLAGLDAEISQLQSSIADNRNQSKQLGDQQTQILEQADQLQQKSLSDQGQQSVDDVASAAKQRHAAADLSIQIDKLDASVVHLQADLTNFQAQHDGVQQVIAQYNKQIDDLNLAWRNVQEDVDKQNQAIAALAGPAAPSGSPDAEVPQPTTIADQCTELKRLIASERELRDQAAGNLKSAIQAFKSAASSGDGVRSAFSDLTTARTTQTEQSRIKELVETFSGSEARLRAAEAEETLAVNYAADAIIATQVKSVTAAAQAALGSDAPAAIGDLATSVASPSADDFTQLAEERFRNALDDYDNQTNQTLQGPAAETRKTMAMAGKMVSAFGAMQLSEVLANKPVAGMTPKELQAVIDDMANQIVQRDPTALPAIPYTLAPQSAPPQ